jgi:hypothetical protein
MKKLANILYCIFTLLVSFLMVGIGLELIYLEWLYKYKPMTVMASHVYQQIIMKYVAITHTITHSTMRLWKGGLVLVIIGGLLLWLDFRLAYKTQEKRKQREQETSGK